MKKIETFSLSPLWLGPSSAARAGQAGFDVEEWPTPLLLLLQPKTTLHKLSIFALIYFITQITNTS